MNGSLESALGPTANGIGSHEDDFQPQSSYVSGRISSVLASSLADHELSESLRLLDHAGFENSQEKRRRLPLDAQKAVIDANAQILEDFGTVVADLRNIGSLLANFQSNLELAKSHVSTAGREIKPILEEADTLILQRREVETKTALFQRFSSHFLLTDEELDHLLSQSVPVDDRFFALLARLKTVHSDCEVLLASEDIQLATSLMDKTSRELQTAFEKLFRWAITEFKNLDLENPQMSAPVRRALSVLALQPVLFQNCLDAFAEVREKGLINSFYATLTGGNNGASAGPKPIEYYAHDAVRYVGDMLAWAHAAIALERETLEALFVAEGSQLAQNVQQGMLSNPWLKDSYSEFDGIKALSQLVNRSFAGVAFDIRRRAEQAIQGDLNAATTFRIMSIIDFYRSTFKKLLGEHSIMFSTLQGLYESAIKHFKTVIEDRKSSISMDEDITLDELRPPGFLHSSLSLVRDLLKTFETTVEGTDSKVTGLETILKECLDPYLQACQARSQQLDTMDSAIFSINCLSATRLVLVEYRFTTKRVSSINQDIDAAAAVLVTGQYSWLVEHSALQALLEQPGGVPEDDSRNIFSDFEPSQLQAMSEKFDGFLPSALLDAKNNLASLQDLAMAEDLTTEAAEKFCLDYKTFEARIDVLDNAASEQGQDGEVYRKIFPRTSHEVRLLLS